MPLQLVVAPTEVPSRITTMYIIALEAVSVSCFTTPLSRNRLPSISIPTRGAVVRKKQADNDRNDDREQDLLQL